MTALPWNTILFAVLAIVGSAFMVLEVRRVVRARQVDRLKQIADDHRDSAFGSLVQECVPQFQTAKVAYDLWRVLLLSLLALTGWLIRQGGLL